MTERRGRGRPAKKDADRRITFGFRVKPDLRARLEKASEVGSRTLSKEIEKRLEESFGEIDRARFGGAANCYLFETIAAAIQNVESTTGRRWWHDRRTFDEAKEAATRVATAVTDFFQPYDKRPAPSKLKDLPPGQLGAWSAVRALAAFQGNMAGEMMTDRIVADAKAKRQTKFFEPSGKVIPQRIAKAARAHYLDKLDAKK